MSETNPSNSVLDALSGTTDAQTGVVYPTKGSMPWYTAFYQLICRLLKVSTRANDLRAFKDGTLTFGVAAGTWYNGDTAISYAGAAAQALTNNATNYVYLTAAGALTVNTSGFPTPSTAPHIPLAIIPTGTASLAGTTGLYDFADIVDCRGMGFLTPAGNSPTPTQVAALAASVNAVQMSVDLDIAVTQTVAKLYIDQRNWQGRALWVGWKGWDATHPSADPLVIAWAGTDSVYTAKAGVDLASDTIMSYYTVSGGGTQLDLYIEAGTGKLYVAVPTYVAVTQFQLNVLAFAQKPIVDITI